MPDLPKLKKVAASETGSTFAASESGALYGWGDFTSTITTAVPVVIRATGVQDIASGSLSYTHMVVTSDGGPWGWGGNFGGQLGDGTQGADRYPMVRAVGLLSFRLLP